LKEEVKKRKNDEKKYHEIATWIVDSWGEKSNYLLGDNWKKFKKARGRPSNLSKFRDITIKYLEGKTLKEIGFPDSEKAGTFYRDIKPKILINLAFIAQNKLNYYDFIFEGLSIEELVQEYFNVKYHNYAILPKGIKYTRFQINSSQERDKIFEKLEEIIISRISSKTEPKPPIA